MAKSKEELVYDIENNLVDSNTGKITGETVKARLLDMVDAMGTGGGGASQMEYWSVPMELLDDTASNIMIYSTSLKGLISGATNIIPTSVLTIYGGAFIPTAFAIDLNMRLCLDSTSLQTLGELFEDTDFSALGFAKITEEEFYTIS